MSNHLDPDQARQTVGPDLGPNCKVYQQAALIGRVNSFYCAKDIGFNNEGNNTITHCRPTSE